MGVNASSNNAAGLLIFDVPSGVLFSSTAPPTIFVSGVRVAVAGTSLTSLIANISSVGNAIVAGQTSVTVISSIAAGIASVGTGTLAEEGIIQGVSGHIDPQPVITVTEGYLDAFKAQGSGDTTSVVLRITLDKNPPAGVSVVFPATATSSPGTGTWTLCNSAGTTTSTRTTITSSSTSLTAYYRVTSGTPTDPTQLETVNITATDFLQVSSTATYPLAATVVNYKVSLAPIGVAINSDGTFPSNIPRFAASDVGPAVLFTVVGSQTTLLLPLSQFVNLGPGNVYDTGISIANTTADPGTTLMGGITSAIKQSGIVTFYFFPQLATPSGTLPAMFSYETKAGSPGTGLDSNGNVPAGSTYTVLLSQLLAAAGATGNFQGYVFAVANFTNAHCLYVLSNFTNFSQGSLALVILPTEGGRAAGNEALNN
jgi:hypothetical protein